MSRKGPFLVAVAALAVIAAIVMAMFSAHHNATASIPTPPSQGDTKVNPKDGLIYVWIPAGTFEMGCSPEDSECESDERPAHTVTITTGFWRGQTEVAQRAHQKVMRTNPSNFHGDRLPVEQVTWDDSDAFCRAVGMRLPTEAEWEYAARAGSTATRYGDVDAIAWYSGNSAFQTHAVGQKQANAWKLYDMLGNAWEWVGDWYDENYYSQSPSEDPRGPSSGQHRMARGGAWNQLAMVNRVSHRLKIDPGNRFQFPTGFRCVGE